MDRAARALEANGIRDIEATEKSIGSSIRFQVLDRSIRREDCQWISIRSVLDCICNAFRNGAANPCIRPEMVKRVFGRDGLICPDVRNIFGHFAALVLLPRSLEMKSLKVVLIALSLSAAVAHAQENTPSQAPAISSQTQQKYAAADDHAERQTARRRSARKENDCVGPVSFCNIYFGS